MKKGLLSVKQQPLKRFGGRYEVQCLYEVTLRWLLQSLFMSMTLQDKSSSNWSNLSQFTELSILHPLSAYNINNFILKYYQLGHWLAYYSNIMHNNIAYHISVKFDINPNLLILTMIFRNRETWTSHGKTSVSR